MRVSFRVSRTLAAVAAATTLSTTLVACSSAAAEPEVTTVTAPPESFTTTTTTTVTVTETTTKTQEPQEDTAAGGNADAPARFAGSVGEPVPAEEIAPAPARSAVHYANCTAVRAAGVAPIYRGEPGYASKLDRDGDGVACE